MPHCFVPGCKNSTRKKSDVSYHSFPKHLVKEWLAIIGRNVNAFIVHERVCSAHFMQNDFEKIGHRRYLKRNSLPSRNLKARFSLTNKLPEDTQPVIRPKSIIIDSNILRLQEFSKDSVAPTTAFNISSSSKSTIVSDETNNGTRWSSSTEDIILPLSSLKRVSSPFKREIDSGSRAASSSQIQNLQSQTVPSSPSSAPAASSSVKWKIINRFHNYSHSPQHYLKETRAQRHKIQHLQSLLTSIQKNCIRRQRRIVNLKQILMVLNKKFSFSVDAMSMLENSVAEIPSVVMKRIILNSKIKGGLRSEYPKELNSFTMSLQFYSNKAYEYVQKTFDLALPSCSTISAWLSKVDCSPGYSQPSLQLLTTRANDYAQKHKRILICSLIFDEMCIKKELVCEKNSQEIWGYTDIGTNVSNSNERELATEAFVLMVVGINDCFKLPVAYFFINKLTEEEKVNIVLEALRQLHKTGIKILSVTCNGPQVHLKMMKELGCNVIDPSSLRTFFMHPVDNSKVYVIFDICQMLKLIRNNWATVGIFIDPEGNEINWKYIVKLHTIQENEELYLGSKLQKKRVEWRKAIMKVNLVAQTFSSSVAEALQFLCEDLELDEFKDVMPTVKFIKTFNGLFDILNSRNIFGLGMKTPLRENNESYWRPFLREAVDYITKCTTIEGKPLHCTLKRVPFLGFLAAVNSFLDMYDSEVKENKSLKYILTHKFSQDHLELFCCNIRSRNGWNNPNCLQFTRIYKQLLLDQVTKSNSGNCIAQDQSNISVLSSSRTPIGITDVITSCLKENYIQGTQKEINIFLPIQLNEYMENVVAYISRFVIKSVETKISCPTCLESLQFSEVTDEYDMSLNLVNKKSRGLILPSLSVRKVCKRVEKKFKQL